ncbi:hypothetical protein ANCDUO_01194 [Ancylostoma duodenale]|uniref:DDE Tnp4 domain-containing protein n=1 Tax=Ancylostoma duodenale TaxID=51022 RepID=A0A0C2DZJ3_9BILA|nr:hypothetical protein ANCDUO_01194 [Ancylostoma duodenale]
MSRHQMEVFSSRWKFSVNWLKRKSSHHRRAYIRREHATFLEKRFRVFDEYLVTRRSEGFLDFIRLLPDKFDDLYQCIGSCLENFLDRNDALFPATRSLGDVGAVQYTIPVDGGFAQGHRFVRPYMEAEVNTPYKRRSDEKLSGARRMIGSTFGILAQRFQILQNCVGPERAARIVTALLILHNLIPRRQDQLNGVRRYAPARNNYFRPLDHVRGREGSRVAQIARDRITQYYVDKYGPASED